MRMLSSVRPVSRANNWPDGIIPYDADRYAQLTLEIMHLLPSLTGVLCLSPSMKGRSSAKRAQQIAAGFVDGHMPFKILKLDEPMEGEVISTMPSSHA